ncbi:MAG: PEP-CTERM sorting domain-containing protein [bacterium]|nr:PEP-CTERM sorting domain-containing protein [bacterium]
MPNKLLASLLLILPIAACSNKTGSLVVADGPAAPINEPDTNVIEPNGETGAPDPSGGSNGSNNSGLPGSGLPGNNGGTGTSQSQNGQPGSNGSNPGGGVGNGNGQGPGTGGGPGTGTGGSQSGSPVPEPGTLLLFGTGLAGFAGFSLRRRKRED